jgi:beta-N-acetylhexosaminidase
MTLDQKLGQLMMLQFTTVGYVGDSVTMMRQIQPGALILYKYELPDAATVKQMTALAQHDAHIPLLISADQEGGFIDQFVQIYGKRPTATEIGAKGDTQYAYQQGAQNAKDMQALGFNLDLAPDVDVQTVDGPDQRTRTFGATPDQVAKMAGAWLQGLQDAGVAGTLKHFPGLGAAQTDAHLDLPVINETRAQIESIDLAPYRGLLAQGKIPGMIMSTDLLMPALAPDTPAELSPRIITDVLRNELHYDGVVLTDALYMHGISAKYSQTQAGVQALVAGCDMLLGPASVGSAAAMIQAIKQAITSGTLTQARIDQSVRRILLLKIRFGLIPLGVGPATIGQIIAQPAGEAEVRQP